jgi:hypothetical protein
LDALSDDIYFDSRDLIDLSTGEPFNPSRYRLTTQAGYEYVLDESFGIKNVFEAKVFLQKTLASKRPQWQYFDLYP